jgi:hypothetical protein
MTKWAEIIATQISSRKSQAVTAGEVTIKSRRGRTRRAGRHAEHDALLLSLAALRIAAGEWPHPADGAKFNGHDNRGTVFNNLDSSLRASDRAPRRWAL